MIVARPKTGPRLSVVSRGNWFAHLQHQGTKKGARLCEVKTLLWRALHARLSEIDCFSPSLFVRVYAAWQESQWAARACAAMSKFCAARLCPRQYLLVAPAGLGLLLLSLLPAAVSSPLSIPVVAGARCRARFRRRAPCRSKNEKMFEMPPIRDEPHTRVAPAAFLQRENANPRWAAHAFGAAETSRTPKWCGSSLHATQRSRSGPMEPIAPSCVASDSVEDLLSANSS